MITTDKQHPIPVLEKGDKLYHYTSVNGLKGICEREFWVTESNFLNDYSEFHVATDVFCDVLDKHIKNTKVRERLKRKVLAELKRLYSFPKVGEKFAYTGEYVISFSLDYDSTLMWSEYSGFMGYCLKFDFEKLCRSFKNKKHFQHGKVIYDHEQQIALFECAIQEGYFNNKAIEYLNSWEDFNSLSDKNINELYMYFALDVDIYNQFFKLPSFEGEHEYRLIFHSPHDGGRYKKEELEEQYFRCKDEVLIPYIKREITSMDALEEVLVGPKNKSDIAVKGVEWFLRNLKLNVPVVKSKMPLRY